MLKINIGPRLYPPVSPKIFVATLLPGEGRPVVGGKVRGGVEGDIGRHEPVFGLYSATEKCSECCQIL